MKQGHIVGVKKFNGPAAFRRLCVETFQGEYTPEQAKAAAFRRLCVETVLSVPRIS